MRRVFSPTAAGRRPESMNSDQKTNNTQEEQPRAFTDLDQLEKDSQTFGKYLRPGTAPIEVVLASGTIERRKNRWARYEYVVPAFLKVDGKFDVMSEPQLLSMSRRAANKFAKAL